MPFPRQFKKLLETKRGEVEEPAHVWITYAVCGIEKGACGWGGWILESVKGPNGNLPAQTEQICPTCGKPLYRTEISIKCAPSPNQVPELIPGRDYETKPLEYE
jgi:hypothetical protein